LTIADRRLLIEKVAEGFWEMLEAGAIGRPIANPQSTIVN
jgi:hypothetical protein